MASSKHFTRRLAVVFIAGAVALWFARPGWIVLGIGAALAALGLALRIWATGYLSKNQRLTREGPYRHLRHPLYFGTWLITTGILLACVGPGAPQALLIPLFLSFQIGFFAYYLVRKEAKEADRLRRSFGQDFDRYREAVPAFLPRLRPVPAPADAIPWSIHQVGANSEWGVGIAVTVAFVFLAVRCAGWLP